MKAAPPLAEFLNPKTLRRMADSRSFQRGEAYFAGGAVVSIVENKGVVAAKVQGAERYRVKLWVEGGALEYECSCPVGRDGLFCKHCVAAGLAWAEEKKPRSGKRSKAKRAVTMDDARAWLAKQDKMTLVEMLMDQAVENDRLRQSLFLKTALAGAKGADLEEFRREIDRAVGTGAFVDYYHARDYARGIDEAIDAVAELLAAGRAVEVIALAEHALARVEKALGSVDDSDGCMGGIPVRLQRLHLAACEQARPDPRDLARRLFDWEMRTAWDTFYAAAKNYENVLGEPGLAVYRELAEAEWKKVPELKPGRDDSEKYEKRFRITSIMETLAGLTGDVEALVEVKKRDLSLAYHYLQIAEVYRQARKRNKALEWAERGVEAFPKHTDSRLREFLAEEYHRRKRHKEAMGLIWAEFEETSRLEQYENLKKHADRGGAWPQWREKALDRLRRAIAESQRPSRREEWGWNRHADNSELVRILLWEKDAEAAWSEAKSGGCHDRLWMELAANRERDYPEDALPVYQRQIEPTLSHGNNEAYRRAVELLRKVRELMVRLDRPAEFDAYLDSIRATFKRKRNFMKMLERAKW